MINDMLDQRIVMKSEYRYQAVVEKYAKAVDEIGLWNSEKIIFLEYIGQSDRILDIGCGAGRTTFSLYQLGFQNIIGVDLSEEIIGACDIIKNKKKIEIPFFVADATKLPFEESLEEAGLKLIRCENRSNLCDESDKVIEFSDECRFWIAEKGISKHLF